MKTQLELWLEKLNSDEKLTQELFEKKSEYSNDEDGLKKFLEEVFVKEAKKNGFDVPLEGALSYTDSYEMQELTPEMLAEVSGGSMRTQLAGIGAASLLLLAAPAVAKAAATAAPSSDVSGISITQIANEDTTQPADILTQIHEQSTAKASKFSAQSQTRRQNSAQKSTKGTKSSGFQNLKAFWEKLTKSTSTPEKSSPTKKNLNKSTNETKTSTSKKEAAEQNLKRAETLTPENSSATEIEKEATEAITGSHSDLLIQNHQEKKLNHVEQKTTDQHFELTEKTKNKQLNHIDQDSIKQEKETLNAEKSSAKQEATEIEKEATEAITGSRSDLLTQIRQGKKLNHVEQKTTEQQRSDFATQLQNGKLQLKHTETRTPEQKSQELKTQTREKNNLLNSILNRREQLREDEDSEENNTYEDILETSTATPSDTQKQTPNTPTPPPAPSKSTTAKKFKVKTTGTEGTDLLEQIKNSKNSQLKHVDIEAEQQKKAEKLKQEINEENKNEFSIKNIQKASEDESSTIGKMFARAAAVEEEIKEDSDDWDDDE